MSAPAGEVVVHDPPTVILPAILTPAFQARGITVPVGSVIPDDYPPLFVTITWVGTDRLNHAMRDAHALVEVRGDDEVEVEDLAALIEGVLLAVGGQYVGDTWVYRIDSRGGPVSTPDVARQLESVQQTVTVRTRGRTA